MVWVGGSVVRHDGRAVVKSEGEVGFSLFVLLFCSALLHYSSSSAPLCVRTTTIHQSHHLYNHSRPAHPTRSLERKREGGKQNGTIPTAPPPHPSSCIRLSQTPIDLFFYALDTEIPRHQPSSTSTTVLPNTPTPPLHRADPASLRHPLHTHHLIHLHRHSQTTTTTTTIITMLSPRNPHLPRQPAPPSATANPRLRHPRNTIRVLPRRRVPRAAIARRHAAGMDRQPDARGGGERGARGPGARMGAT